MHNNRCLIQQLDDCVLPFFSSKQLCRGKLCNAIIGQQLRSRDYTLTESERDLRPTFPDGSQRVEEKAVEG